MSWSFVLWELAAIVVTFVLVAVIFHIASVIHIRRGRREWADYMRGLDVWGRQFKKAAHNLFAHGKGRDEFYRLLAIRDYDEFRELGRESRKEGGLIPDGKWLEHHFIDMAGFYLAAFGYTTVPMLLSGYELCNYGIPDGWHACGPVWEFDALWIRWDFKGEYHGTL